MLFHPSQRYLCAALAFLSFSSARADAATKTLVDLNFNDLTKSYDYYASPGVTSKGTYAAVTSGANALFLTAPTSGYLALTPNASTEPASGSYGGWWAGATLATINSEYTAGGLGQSDLSKISLTAKVRVRGMPANGAAVILKLVASGDNPNAAANYKRIQFEPNFLAGNDWTTIGGTLDTAGLTAGKGSTYNFPTIAASYQVLVELSGFNQYGTSAYVAYNSPTGPSNGGRKNPGFGFTSGIRVEVDDLKLVVTDPATTGYAAPMTSAQLLRNGDFNSGDANWYRPNGGWVSTETWSEDSSSFFLIPGWEGGSDAFLMQSGISFASVNGNFFTATFRAKFDEYYQAGSTIVAFMNATSGAPFKEIDISSEINEYKNQWHTYTASFLASTADLATMTGGAATGAMSLKIQPLNRVWDATGATAKSALFDNVVLSQATSASVGPQISVKLNAVPQIDDGNTTLISPPVGKTATYALKLENTGAENLIISSITLSGSSISLVSTTLPATITPGSTKTFSITTTPTSTASIASTLTISSNDKEVADQAFVVNLSASPVNLNESFNGTETPAALGWSIAASTEGLLDASDVTATGGNLEINVDSSADDYPWSYSISKKFASPGPLDLSGSSLLVALKASGILAGSGNNKIQIRLESLNNAQAITGSIQLGAWVDETTANSIPDGPTYRQTDGINDRVVVYVPDNSATYTVVGGSLSSSSTGVNTAFDTNAPYYRIVIQMTDREFGLYAANLVTIDSINLQLALKPFALANGSFEEDLTNPGGPTATPTPPKSWSQFPSEGVSKDIIPNGDKIYNQFTKTNSGSVTNSAYAGTKVMKVFGQNYYPGGVWGGNGQTGTIYQEFLTSAAPTLAAGTVIHARGVAKVFSIDPLTGESTFNYGFKFMSSANSEISRTVTTLTANNFTLDKWLPLTVNATIPAGTERVQLISEFVQNKPADLGAVYLDDLSVGFGTINATTTVSGSTYSLVWSDEFDGTSLNSANWTPETGGGGWGNNEQQTYTSDSANLRVDSGNLIIQAVKSGSSWTSARIKSQGKRPFQYGKIEFRAKLPTGRGPWPAAWLLGTNISSVNWPACGEIDVMEWRAGTNGSTSDMNTVGHALHSLSRHGGNPFEPTPARTPVSNPSTQFHTYAVLWESNKITFSVDGTNGTPLTPVDQPAFQKEFFLILNMAVGGNYVGGYIDPSLTQATYEVDYVRVYQDPATLSSPLDTIAPNFTYNGLNPVNLSWGASYTDAGVTAFDDGDNAAVTVTTNNPVNTGVPGSYVITYTAKDSKSNSSTTNRTVKVSMSNGGTNRGTDGLSDALRYAYGGTGTSPISTSLLPSNSISGSNLVLTYFARTNSNVTLTPVVSTDLSVTNSWTNSGVSVSTLSTTATNGTVLEKRQATTPVSGPKKFLKLNVLFTNP
jgi:beta-glucanase (GH16 family)